MKQKIVAFKNKTLLNKLIFYNSALMFILIIAALVLYAILAVVFGETLGLIIAYVYGVLFWWLLAPVIPLFYSLLILLLVKTIRHLFFAKKETQKIHVVYQTADKDPSFKKRIGLEIALVLLIFVLILSALVFFLPPVGSNL